MNNNISSGEDFIQRSLKQKRESQENLGLPSAQVAKDQSEHSPASRNIKYVLGVTALSAVALLVTFRDEVIQVVQNVVHPSHAKSKQVDKDAEKESPSTEPQRDINDAILALKIVLADEYPDAGKVIEAVEILKEAAKKMQEGKHSAIVGNLLGKFNTVVQELEKNPDAKKLRFVLNVWDKIPRFIRHGISAPLEKLRTVQSSVSALVEILSSDNPDGVEVQEEIDTIKEAIEELKSAKDSPTILFVVRMLEAKFDEVTNMLSNPNTPAGEKVERLKSLAESFKSLSGNTNEEEEEME